MKAPLRRRALAALTAPRAPGEDLGGYGYRLGIADRIRAGNMKVTPQYVEQVEANRRERERSSASA
jgi:hypothetical protein